MPIPGGFATVTAMIADSGSDQGNARENPDDKPYLEWA